jgi:hypothetical protein
MVAIQATLVTMAFQVDLMVIRPTDPNTKEKNPNKSCMATPTSPSVFDVPI